MHPHGHPQSHGHRRPSDQSYRSLPSPVPAGGILNQPQHLNSGGNSNGTNNSRPQSDSGESSRTTLLYSGQLPPPIPSGPSRASHSLSFRNTPHSAPVAKQKKRRIALSCAECSKRKQKCNRETPCQHCKARGVPELCLPSKAGEDSSDKEKKPVIPTINQRGIKRNSLSLMGESSRPQPLPTLTVRVTRIEALVNAMVNRIDGIDETKALQDWRINHAPATSPSPLDYPRISSDDQSLSPSRLPMNDQEDLLLERETEGREGGVTATDIDRDTIIRNPLPQSMVESNVPLGLDYHGTPAERMTRLFQDCGVNPSELQRLVSELPGPGLRHQLTEWFFRKINFVRYPISQENFGDYVKLIYESPALEAMAVIGLPLVCIVFAMAIRVAPLEWIGDEEQRRTYSLKMYWNSRTAIILSSALMAESLPLVETKILTGLYLVLMHERRLAEGWCEFRSALSVGQAILLHRDGTKLGLNAKVTEYRRRLWSYLVHADATYSCLIGRPTSINQDCVDTHPPLNLDLGEISPDGPASPKLMDIPTFATYLILRHRLGLIVAKITNHFQRLRSMATYKVIEDLDAELKEFVKDLPAAFRMHDFDRSYDTKLWFLPVHRYYIQTEILHFTIILHVSLLITPFSWTLGSFSCRPYLLRKLRQNRYALSRNACFEAAVTDWKIRNAFKRDCPDFFETLLGGSFREFNAAMIAGISIILNPHGSQADDMRKIMKSFMDQYPHDPKADDFSQKEVGIIYTLHRRAMANEELRAKEERRMKEESHRPHPPHHSHPAHPTTHPDRPSFTAISSERDNRPSPPHPHPSNPRPSTSGGPPTTNPNQTPSRSPLVNSFLRNEGRAHSHSSPGMGSSSEDDHPQRLLDHWIYSNTQFGPADTALGLQQYQAYPQPGLPGYINGSQVPLMQQGGMVGQGYTDLGGFGGFGGWGDPNVGGGGPLMGMGMADPSLMSGALTGGIRGSLAETDGNNSVYWNALVDGEFKLWSCSYFPSLSPNFRILLSFFFLNLSQFISFILFPVVRIVHHLLTPLLS
ncbi:hypothetical protein TREMEDRAFT_27559 [Tremella mesenterica DSM 1558]|uniref:uncharacterized protein n=1 Tax=Tremella mesenterica (strain ATCC 24925 / CBS 8224 / DSM 1558 / NBRC 9311 / NRRL Y-6157 / RJB 2259-6 / UBC 559-6) TaxID=578456 RepID=UPI0003F4A12F|nr:uncharacterized protein TREMEDRAFT_27559 [Tremella mesenterica DSM 1558]EIW71030.1 hypothetical protein TREMEDRAFT_27559 [Tremella mesenterica DSM 1558]